jgi:hypothetical protein
MADEPENIMLQHLIAIRADMASMRTDVTTLSDGQTVLTNLLMQVLRDMEQVKRLGRMDARISHLEKAPP